MMMKERRRRIETETRKHEIASLKQKQKLGKNAFMAAVNAKV